jgi:hypothetical protein
MGSPPFSAEPEGRVLAPAKTLPIPIIAATPDLCRKLRRDPQIRLFFTQSPLLTGSSLTTELYSMH